MYKDILKLCFLKHIYSYEALKLWRKFDIGKELKLEYKNDKVIASFKPQDANKAEDIGEIAKEDAQLIEVF